MIGRSVTSASVLASFGQRESDLVGDTAHLKVPSP